MMHRRLHPGHFREWFVVGVGVLLAVPQIRALIMQRLLNKAQQTLALK